MKKNIILGMTGAIALLSFTACDQKLLDIPQKGVIAYEDFYQTDEDAQSALTSAYTEFVGVFNAQGSNNPAWNVVVNAMGDELYWGGGKKNGSSGGAQEMNEFRKAYDSTIGHIKVTYKKLYSVIYKCNLVIDNFYGENGELSDTPVKKRCVAEARVLRAWAHFTLACWWGTPPLVEHVLPGDARPTNCDHQVRSSRPRCPTCSRVTARTTKRVHSVSPRVPARHSWVRRRSSTRTGTVPRNP